MSQWYLIDGDGRRPLSRRTMDFWSKFEYSGDEPDWPAFTQLVVDATRENLVKAVDTVAEMVERRPRDVTDEPAAWNGALCIAQNGEALSLAEPRVDLDERFLRDEVADAMAGLLACNGAFFGHDPSTGLIHVTTFDLGAPELAWYDSTEPGPSFARTFHRDGRATEEDPRSYALRLLDMPDTSPLLDRYAFVHRVLSGFGIDAVSPELDDLEIVQVLALDEDG